MLLAAILKIRALTYEGLNMSINRLEERGLKKNTQTSKGKARGTKYHVVSWLG